ncbi:MAG: endonuclease/exonuclease/phosphatase family protein [Stackebrandtia sp.]
MNRRTVLSGLAFGAAVAVVGAPGTAAAQEPESHKPVKLRVATFNIHHAEDPDGVISIERVASIIESMDVDIVGLQELDRFYRRSEFVDQPYWLSSRLGMQVVFGANIEREPDDPAYPPRQYGTAILSRWPLTKWKNTFLPKLGDSEQRGLLQATAIVKGHKFIFSNTHLQHDDNIQREMQAEAIVELLGPEPAQTVLVGDMNGLPGTPEIEILKTAFEDVWDLQGDGPGYTYPSRAPDVRIDYVFGASDVEAKSAEVFTGDPLASDHMPLTAVYLVGEEESETEEPDETDEVDETETPDETDETEGSESSDDAEEPENSEDEQEAAVGSR